MNTRRLLIVICEAALEKQLLADLRNFGAQGYTITDVRGGGTRGERDGMWEADRSIELKVVCEASIAHKLGQHLIDTYSKNFGMTLFIAAGEVLRPERY